MQKVIDRERIINILEGPPSVMAINCGMPIPLQSVNAKADDYEALAYYIENARKRRESL